MSSCSLHMHLDTGTHTCLHVSMHTHAHTPVLACEHIHTPTCMGACTHMVIHLLACEHAHMCIYLLAWEHAHIWAYTCLHVNMHTHKQKKQKQQLGPISAVAESDAAPLWPGMLSIHSLSHTDFAFVFSGIDHLSA